MAHHHHHLIIIIIIIVIIIIMMTKARTRGSLVRDSRDGERINGKGIVGTSYLQHIGILDKQRLSKGPV
ncbi:unnamed protein product [Pleuronectes platessa]|uniref:Transmembrane protein n=1 Tax=Pleuronectes platessa TaxID=8262 RepID=A0A9N7VJI3_PLEPL|nr:unnamed protein product [Pleuronectes platessa]